MPQRICLDCRRRYQPTGPIKPGRAARCPPCQQARDRQRQPSPSTATRDWAERQRRAATVAAHRERYGDWCPGWGRPPHPATDLTADHPTAVAQGGAQGQAHTVLCRSCNSSKKHNAASPPGGQGGGGATG